jgi:hypothetical protein
MSVIDQTLEEIIAEKNEAVIKMEWWRSEAESWRAKALELDAQLETAVSTLATRISRIESNIHEMKGDY